MSSTQKANTVEIYSRLTQISWYLSTYKCPTCGGLWEDEWSCGCDDEFPNCGEGDISPLVSEDLTTLIVTESGGFAVYHSPEWASDKPRYELHGIFETLDLAKAQQLLLDDSPPRHL